ncbi:hypothetical protein R6Q59_007651 [Mikania micrantha]|uniref:Transcription repressor n=1 Tax=Mikania micrantha TaxID=192012 RepID=A0A5N6Q2Z3_9ASTR|nr:hypothetical protein E3N88_01334 [Mikania micrantha]
MGRTIRNLPFLPTCATPTKTLSFRASTAEFDAGDDVESSVESVIRGLRSDRFFFNPGQTSSILEESKPCKEKEKEKEKESVLLPLKESVSMMEMESTDPFVDFKKSMQEMMEADEGYKQWDNLQELLSLYLSVNDKLNHGYIIGAFVDLLLVNLGSPSKPSSSSSSTINGQKQSLSMESAATSSSNNNNKLNMMSSSESPEYSGVSFTSSFASSSGVCSSGSHFLSSCSLEDDEDEDDDENEDEDDDGGGGDNHGDDEDHNCPQKASVSDHSSCLKV